MDVTLPNGQLITDIPAGTTQVALIAKLKANGMSIPDSWSPGGKPPLAESLPTLDAPPPPAAPPQSAFDKLMGTA